MTTSDMIAKQRLSLLLLAKQINNISKACQMFGVSRETFYKYKDRFDQLGLIGLKEKERNSPKMPNQTKPEIEEEVLKYCINHPTFGPLRVSNELEKASLKISSSGAYNILKRRGLNRRYDRLLALEKQTLAQGIVLSAYCSGLLKRTRFTCLSNVSDSSLQHSY